MLISFGEILLRNNGWQPSISDSQQLWAQQRSKASKAGNKAIVFLGASRIQLGIDLDVVQKITNLRPFQLAIEGNPFMPVLENLANDPAFTGTIVISPNNMDFNKNYLKTTKSAQWTRKYQDQKNTPRPIYKQFDSLLSSWFNDHMSSRMHGARPFTVLNNYLPRKYTGGYIFTDINRSRSGDYRAIPDQSMFYASRLQKHFGPPLTEKYASLDQFFALYEVKIADILPLDNTLLKNSLKHLLITIQSIKNRGGKVIFVRFPTDKLIWEIDTKKRPRTQFWDILAKHHPACYHFSDYPSLMKYDLPDGSHIDLRDKTSFTKDLLTIIDPAL